MGEFGMKYNPEQTKIDAERLAFQERMAAEAEKLSISEEDFIEDYAREEHASREAESTEPASIYERGPGSAALERQIKQTIFERIKSGIDSLTEINNRSSFKRKIEDLQSSLQKRRQGEERRGKEKEVMGKDEFSLIMIDIDHFKKVNDTYGHPAGDAILREVAQTLKENTRTRSGDFLARYGGEEMVIIASNANGDAAGFAERLRKIIEQKRFQFKGEIIPVTISVGVAPYNADTERMKELADRGLYLAKGEQLKLKEGEGVPVIEGQTGTRNAVWYFDGKMFKKYETKE